MQCMVARFHSFICFIAPKVKKIFVSWIYFRSVKCSIFKFKLHTNLGFWWSRSSNFAFYFKPSLPIVNFIKILEVVWEMIHVEEQIAAGLRYPPILRSFALRKRGRIFQCWSNEIIHQSKSFIYQQTHFIPVLENIKIYIKICIKIAPTYFGLRPSSGSLHMSLAKITFIKLVEVRLYGLCGCVAACCHTTT
jgi:hypothetical protein